MIIDLILIIHYTDSLAMEEIYKPVEKYLTD